ncbi:hypothetical protein ACJX0J_022838 [Zea mays]
MYIIEREYMDIEIFNGILLYQILIHVRGEDELGPKGLITVGVEDISAFDKFFVVCLSLQFPKHKRSLRGFKHLVFLFFGLDSLAVAHIPKQRDREKTRVCYSLAVAFS